MVRHPSLTRSACFSVLCVGTEDGLQGLQDQCCMHHNNYLGEEDLSYTSLNRGTILWWLSIPSASFFRSITGGRGPRVEECIPVLKATAMGISYAKSGNSVQECMSLCA